MTVTDGLAQCALAGGGEHVTEGFEFGFGLAAGLDTAREVGFIGFGQQRVAADLVEVDPNEVFRHLFS